ncbi:MAG: two-component sensor histidine kinase, partial [Leucobacter sp.]|nr:two-component sensor histidine kinase [Leucobacter sp.]
MSNPNEYTPGELALPRPPGVFRRWLTAHPRAVDWVIVATYLFGSAVMLLIMVVFLLNVDAFLAVEGDTPDDAEFSQALVKAGHLTFGWGAVMLLSVALVAAALLYRRRYPVVGVVLVSLLMYLDLGLLVVGNTVALALLMFAVPGYRGVKAGWLAFAAAVLLAIGYSVLTNGMGGVVGPEGIAVTAPSESVTDLVIATGFNSAWLLAVLMVGLNVGNRKRYVEALIDRAHQLAREREQRAQLAAAAERNRIAREMHDIVAHSLSVVVTLSEAASVAIDTQPQAAKSAMQRASD